MSCNQSRPAENYVPAELPLPVAPSSPESREQPPGKSSAPAESTQLEQVAGGVHVGGIAIDVLVAVEASIARSKSSSISVIPFSVELPDWKEKGRRAGETVGGSATKHRVLPVIPYAPAAVPPLPPPSLPPAARRVGAAAVAATAVATAAAAAAPSPAATAAAAPQSAAPVAPVGLPVMPTTPATAASNTPETIAIAGDGGQSRADTSWAPPTELQSDEATEPKELRNQASSPCANLGSWHAILDPILCSRTS